MFLIYYLLIGIVLLPLFGRWAMYIDRLDRGASSSVDGDLVFVVLVMGGLLWPLGFLLFIGLHIYVAASIAPKENLMSRFIFGRKK